MGDRASESLGKALSLSVLPLAPAALWLTAGWGTGDEVPIDDLSSVEGLQQTVAETPTRARTADGRFISWREHRIDDQELAGGLELRGADGLELGDFDRDGFEDIVSDLDLVAARGNSGQFDGVLWLEQIRSNEPRPAFEPARTIDSRHLPLPPQ